MSINVNPTIWLPALRSPPVHLSFAALALGPALSGRWRALPCLLLGLVLAGQASAQWAGPPEQEPRLSITTWTVRDGVPANTLLDVLQTRDGYLWLATYDGLVRFDGVRFVSMSPGADGPEAGNIWRLHQDQHGVLWAGANGGLIRYAGGRFQAYTGPHGLEGQSVRAVLRDPGGTLWVGTKTGVLRQQGERFVPIAAPPAAGGDLPSVTSLAADGAGGLWIGTADHGLLHFRGGKHTRLFAAPAGPDGRVRALLRDREGTLWIGAAGEGLLRYRDGVLAKVADRGAHVPVRVQTLAEDAQGVLWIGADNGLFRLRHGRLAPVLDSQERPITLITALHADAEGSVWVATHRSGLYHVRHSSVEVLRPGAGTPSEVVYAITGDGAGGAWVGSSRGLVHRSGEGSERRFSKAAGELPDLVVRDIVVGRDGSTWLATFSGLARLRGGSVEVYTTRDGLADNMTRVLAEDGDGGLWIGSFNGLTLLRDGRFRAYDARDGLPDPYVLGLHADRAGTLWISTQTAGLVRRRNGRFEQPPELAELAGGPVFRVREDPDGTLWIGSTRGLARLRNGRLVRVTQAHGLPSNTIFEVLEDDLGYFWLTSNRGVIRVSRADADAVADGRRSRVRAKLFGRAEGLPSDDATAVARSWKAPDGTLWFATTAGVARMDPRRLQNNPHTPPVHIEQLRVNGAVAGLEQGGARIGPAVRRLEIAYTAPSFLDPAQVRFRYRLQGYDQDWVDAGAQRLATYTNLPPGSYTFRVIASNEDGVWNQQGATVSLRVQPHFYQTPWFRGSALALALAAVLALFRRHLRQVQRSSRQAEREASRQRVAQILESVTDCFVALDPEGRLVYVNQAAEQHFRRSRDALLGTSSVEAFGAPEIDLRLREALGSGEPAVFDAVSPLQPDRWLEFRAYPTAGEGASVYFSDITERKRAEAALHTISLSDQLTGLYNRRGLLLHAEDLSRDAAKSGRGFDVVFIDMDGMKQINDRLGHSAGDQALRDVATVLRRTFRESDVLARLGGDEFVALVTSRDQGEADPFVIAERVQDAVQRFNDTADRPFRLRVSVGSSRFDPANPIPVEQLLEHADKQMYQAKRGKQSRHAAADSGAAGVLEAR